MTDPSAQPMITCPSCGTASPQGATVCGNCGASLTGAAPAPAAPAQPPGVGIPSQRPALSDSDSRNWAMGAHLSALAGFFLGGVASFVGPLVVWLIRREDDQFSANHALEALNFNLMILGLVIVGWIITIGTIGFGFLLVGPLWLVMGILALIWTIQASMAASRGESYRYPVSVRLIKQ